jgi:hypothetical protein
LFVKRSWLIPELEIQTDYDWFRVVFGRKTASRIIKDTLKAGLIRCYDDLVGSKAKKYLPG